MSSLAYALINKKNDCAEFFVNSKAMVYYNKTND